MKRRGPAATLGPLFFLLCLLGQDLPELATRLAADELEVRAAAEASLAAADYSRVGEIRSLRDACRDLEARARLDAIVLRILRRESRRLYDAGELSESLNVLAETERPDARTRAEARLKELLRGRSMEFSTGGVTVPDPADVEPLLPWVYPALLRRLADGSPDKAAAFQVLFRLGDRAVPAVCWALRTSTPSVQVQACLLLDRIGASSALARESLKGAAAAPDAEVRRFAAWALRRFP